MNQIVFKTSDWLNLNNYMSLRSDVESGAYAIYKSSNYNDSKKLLVTQVLIPMDEDYYKRSSACVAFSPGFTEKALQQCDLTGGNLLDIHNHPWSTNVNFSHIDDNEAKQIKIPYIIKYMPNNTIAFIVFGKSLINAQARFWDKTKNRISDIDRLLIV